MDKWLIFSLVSIGWGVLVLVYFQKDGLKKHHQSFVPVSESSMVLSGDIIAVPQRNYRIIFDTPEVNVRALSDYTVKLSDLQADNYTFPQSLTGERNDKEKPEVEKPIEDEEKVILPEPESSGKVKVMPDAEIVSVANILNTRYTKENKSNASVDAQTSDVNTTVDNEKEEI